MLQLSKIKSQVDKIIIVPMFTKQSNDTAAAKPL